MTYEIVSNEERVQRFRRWRQYVKKFPRRYKIELFRCGDRVFAALLEKIRDSLFWQDPRYHTVLRTNCGTMVDWSIVEHLPPWNMHNGNSEFY